MKIDKSETLFAEAQKITPGGVNSPVRAFRGVGGVPRFIERGEGPYLYDVDGNKYVDYVLSWGPLIHGHAHPQIVDALHQQAKKGTSFGAPTELETQLAQRIARLMPAVEMVRFVSSGTEAVMSVIRLARAHTKRNKIIKFSGCYHGHADMLLVQAGSGVATLGLPDSPGVSPLTTADTLTAPYNNLAAVEQLLNENSGEVAAILIEPVAGNMGMVLPEPGFLEGLRLLANKNGTLLIFDEVMTGFRVSLGGAQQHFNVVPDLTCLGKVIGGGLPAAAYGGRRDIMREVAPSGAVYQAGTLSGNPLAMVAGITTLDLLSATGVHEKLTDTAEQVVAALKEAAAAASIDVQASSVGSMWGFFLNSSPVRSYEEAKTSNTKLFSEIFHRLLEHGVYIAPSQFEAGFVSTVHTAETLSLTKSAFQRAFSGV